MSAFDLEAVRAQFPVLHQQVHGKPLAYLDNAATTQKPRCVLQAMQAYYEHDNANVHRGVHALSERATLAFEEARRQVALQLGGVDPREVVFVRGTTEAINLVAHSFGSRLGPGDEVLITEMEHHSNIVPWQLLCQRSGAVLRVAPVDDAGEIDLERFEALLGPRTSLVAVGHASNALGTVNPVRAITELAHSRGVPVLVDGAQAIPHQPVDVQALGADFYAFSGHKAYGPTGIGALWGRAELLESMPPFQGGGEMIRLVSFERSTYAPIPHKFEAGTPDMAGAIGMGAALAWLRDLPAGASDHEARLLRYALGVLAEVPRVRLLGPPPERRISVVSFVMDGIHPHDIGTILDREGVAIRTGHHCTQPLMRRFGVAATARASFAVYNTEDEVDRLAAGLRRAIEVLG